MGDTELMNANVLAAELGRSRNGVIKAIARLGIEPAARDGGRPLYDRAALELLEAEMREPRTIGR